MQSQAGNVQQIQSVMQAQSLNCLLPQQGLASLLLSGNLGGVNASNINNIPSPSQPASSETPVAALQQLLTSLPPNFQQNVLANNGVGSSSFGSVEGALANLALLLNPANSNNGLGSRQMQQNQQAQPAQLKQPRQQDQLQDSMQQDSQIQAHSELQRSQQQQQQSNGTKQGNLRDGNSLQAQRRRDPSQSQVLPSQQHHHPSNMQDNISASAVIAVAPSLRSTSQTDREEGASGNNNKDESLDVLWKMINEDKKTTNEDTMSILGDIDGEDTLSLLPDLDQNFDDR